MIPAGLLAEAVRLYLDTSALGGVLDHEDPRRVAASRELLLAVSSGKHTGLISNVVQVASAARADALVSWNFRRLVNIRTRRAVHGANVRLGYPLIEIVSPEEVP